VLLPLLACVALLCGCRGVSGLSDFEIGGAGGGGDGGAGQGGDDMRRWRDLTFNDALIVRYWIDEPMEALDGGKLYDAGDTGLDLVLSSPGNELSWVSDAGGAGVRWNTLEGAGRAAAPLPTPTFDQIEGLTRFTIELVVGGLAGDATNDRFLFHIGTGSSRGLTLTTENDDQDRFVLSVNNLEYVRFGGVPPLTQRTVVHVMINLVTSSATLVLDGALPAIVGTPTGSAAIVTLFEDSELVLGNNNSLPRSPIGNIYYAALYGRRFSPSQAADNAAELIAQHDGLLD
jgi:hypothetical protein